MSGEKPFQFQQDLSTSLTSNILAGTPCAYKQKD